MLLSATDLSVGHGPKVVVHAVSLEVREREVVALIGHNGAGKSTLLDGLFGVLPLRGGDITWLGHSIAGLPPSYRLKHGMSYVPQGGRVYPSLSIEENLELGGFTLGDRRRVRQSMQKIYELFPVLFERRHGRAGLLSGGERQMLALGSVLMSQPRLALLDEPSGGLAPILLERSFAKIREIVDSLGTSVLLVEQNLDHAFAIADRAYVMANGRVTMSGLPAEIVRHAQFAESYFGVGAPEPAQR